MGKEKKEITKIIERFDLLEEKFGITISGLYATCDHEPDEYTIQINFDVTSLSGGKLGDSLRINASAYNSVGQLLQKNDVSLYGSEGFSSESISLWTDQEPVRIRLFPTSR